MPNLIDKLVTKVDALRQKAADKFGLPRFNMYRVIRTYTSGITGDGSFTLQEDEIYPTPEIEIKGGDKLTAGGRHDDRTMEAREISLTYTENWLQGEPLSAGQECYYKLVERNTQGKDTTYWILTSVPQDIRDDINWVLEFKRFEVC